MRTKYMRLHPADITAIADAVAKRLRTDSPAVRGRGAKPIGEALTPDQAAKRLGYKSGRTLLRAVRTHAIPCVRVSRKVVRFDPAELERYLKGGISR